MLRQGKADKRLSLLANTKFLFHLCLWGFSWFKCCEETSQRQRGTTFHVTHQLENQHRGRSFAPPRWGHRAEPWWIGVRRATPPGFMIKAYYVGKLTLIADLNHWNQLICQCWIESMGNSVCPPDRLDGKKPGGSRGLSERCQLCLEAVKSYCGWLTADTKNREMGGEEKTSSEEENQKPLLLMWVIAQKFGPRKTRTARLLL